MVSSPATPSRCQLQYPAAQAEPQRVLARPKSPCASRLASAFLGRPAGVRRVDFGAGRANEGLAGASVVSTLDQAAPPRRIKAPTQQVDRIRHTVAQPRRHRHPSASTGKSNAMVVAL